MNAVEIEEAVSELALAPFDRAEFPFAFLAAFGNKDTAIQRLRSGNTNQSDIPGGVLQRNHIHLATCDEGKVGETLTALRASPRNAKAKPKFVFATDGIDFEAEELATGEVTGLQKLPDIANHFGFFLPLAGISTVAEIKNNPIDIKATSRLNKLYVELLKENPDWATAERRPALNQFLVRLIFCFFAEDTGIFTPAGLFSTCLQQMTAADSSNTHEVVAELFRAMNTPTQHNNAPDPRHRDAANIKGWARPFPYVNGKLFSGSTECPRFSKIARSYLIRAGELDWKQINPDIFGSMIQAVADDDERGELGMHYTSVPNILKVLDPLFLDDLREELEKAEGNPRKLLNLRKRIANVRVFDPACGSGNFLVIAYIKMREIEAEIVKRRGEHGDMFAQKSWIKLTNFFGIEIKSFAAEVARLSLLIAEFQSNVRLIGQREACLDVLPLHDTGKIVNGNALRLDWLEVCPPPNAANAVEEDLGGSTGKLALDAKDAEVETYICGNPPFKGARKQSTVQKEELCKLFGSGDDYKDCDYVSGWYLKATDFINIVDGALAFVSTSSVCEGEQVQHIWKRLFERGCRITFAHRAFAWRNNASNNAMVTCVIVGLGVAPKKAIGLYDGSEFRACSSIAPYLVPGGTTFVSASNLPISSAISDVVAGSMPRDGGNLIISQAQREVLLAQHPNATRFIKRLSGTNEMTGGYIRWCLWIDDNDLAEAELIPFIKRQIDAVRDFRIASTAGTTQGYARIPHKFAQRSHRAGSAILIGATSSQNREYLPADLCGDNLVVSNAAYVIYGSDLIQLSVLVSKLHLAWVATVCGRMKTDFRFSKTLGWNTFPVPTLTENQKADLTRCAEDILLAREHYWPATIADMYDPDRMDSEFPLVRAAHEKNDETLERIYIGRRFKNDTERLEKLFDMYTKMTAAEAANAPKKNGRKSKSSDDSPAA